ncbi:glycosyltransferase family 92 protein ZK381.2-like isoform X2 [Mixophyes fleayi]|uniref:glycosyltransferase family 92 protein ZK381.2-like isoform X2 n=1 Tax=Mixophyes fleayi TaxID=3061075 RepID=UPI003F4DA8F3
MVFTGEERAKQRYPIWAWKRNVLYLRQSFMVCCLVITLTLLSTNFYLHRKYANGKNIFIQCNQCNSSETSYDTITPLRGNRTFIIAPYYDNREGKTIRVLGFVHTKVKKLYCHFYGTVDMCRHISEAKLDMHSDRFGFPFGLTDIICEEPPNCRPTYVCLDESPVENIEKLTRFKIQNREHGEFTANFTVCISTLYGNYNNTLQFIQTIEMYKLLGAQKVIIYLQNCSHQVKQVLEYYSKEGTIEVIPWPIQKYMRASEKWYYEKNDKEIGYYGQIASLNDCLYRNMYRSKFVLLNDIDEIILPFQHQTWDSMMESLKQQNPEVGIFLFESYAFPQTVITHGNFSGVSSWKEVPGFDLLQHANREPARPHVFNGRKMIVDPRTVIQTSVHSVLKSVAGSVNVPVETALVHHCRPPQQPHLNETSLIDDRTIWKYNASLIRNVNQVLNRISLQGQIDIQTSKSYFQD